MKSVNKVQLIGYLGQDPEVRYTQNQTCVTTLSLGTTEVWGKDGQKTEKTEWHRVVIWGKLGEIIGQYAKKGRQAYVEGRLETRKWQDKSGTDRYTTEIQVNGPSGNVMLLGPNPDRESSSQGGSEPPTFPSAGSSQRQGFGAVHGRELTPDEIPF